MNKYQPRNDTAHGGKETVIGGRPTYLPGTKTVRLPEAVMMPKASALHISSAKPVALPKESFNPILGALHIAGILTSEVMAA